MRSGVTSTEYFDKYRFEADPVLLRDLAVAMAPLVPAGVDALAGLELGGVPLATMLSQVTGLPARFVRKAAKTYGTCQLAEGGELEGARLCIVEDVVTSGGAVLDAASRASARGATLGTVVCVIDRESGGSEKLARGRPRTARAVHDDAAPPFVTSTWQSWRIALEALALGSPEHVVGFQPLFPEPAFHRPHHARRLCRGEPGIHEVLTRRAGVVSGIRAPGPDHAEQHCRGHHRPTDLHRSQDTVTAS